MQPINGVKFKFVIMIINITYEYVMSIAAAYFIGHYVYLYVNYILNK